MKKLLLLLVLLLFPAKVFAGKPATDLYERVLYPTVGIQNRYSNGHVATATGVIVRIKKDGDEYVNTVYTACHVINHPEATSFVLKPVYVNHDEFVKFDTFPAKIKAMDVVDETGVVEFRSKEKLFTAEIDKKHEIHIGNSVFGVGIPTTARQPRLLTGIITSVNFTTIERKGLIRTSEAVVWGDSGGPVFNDYKLIGVHQSIDLVSQNVPYGVTYLVPLRSFEKIDK